MYGDEPYHDADDLLQEDRAGGRIPFDITADPDPFYSESNVRYLKNKLDAGTLPLEPHELIEVD